MKSALPPTSSAAAWAPSHADWLNDLSSTLPTSVTRPMDTSSTGSRASQSVAGAEPADVVSVPAGRRRSRCRRPPWCPSRRPRRSCPCGVVVVVVATARRQHQARSSDDGDELGRFHAPPQFLVRWIGCPDTTPPSSKRNSDGRERWMSELTVRAASACRYRAGPGPRWPPAPAGQPASELVGAGALVAVAREARGEGVAEQAPARPSCGPPSTSRPARRRPPRRRPRRRCPRRTWRLAPPGSSRISSSGSPA